MHDPPPCPSSALFSFPHRSFSCTCGSFHLIILSFHYCLFCTLTKLCSFRKFSFWNQVLHDTSLPTEALSNTHFQSTVLGAHAKTSFSRTRLSVVLPLLLPLTCKPSHTRPPTRLYLRPSDRQQQQSIWFPSCLDWFIFMGLLQGGPYLVICER